MSSPRRRWPWILLLVACILIAATHLLVEYLTREGPNYSQIEPGLFLGGHVSSPPRGTRAVLNLCRMDDPFTVEVVRREPILDAAPAPGLDWLREQVAFLDAQREAHRPVFVHCRNGVSRSGMVVIAHLMARHGWTRDAALDFVRERRPQVRPNPDFMQRLDEWEKALSGKRP